MILACQNIEKSFGEQIIVRNGSFHIEEREKAALVGVNGAGKSTILKTIMGEEPLDGGNVVLSKGKAIGYLAQHFGWNSVFMVSVIVGIVGSVVIAVMWKADADGYAKAGKIIEDIKKSIDISGQGKDS